MIRRSPMCPPALLAFVIGTLQGTAISLAEPAMVADSEITDAISREVSVFALSSTPTIKDANSREVSAFVYDGPHPLLTDAVSREVSAFTVPSPVQVNDATSREVSTFSVIPLTLGTPYDGSLPVGTFLYFRVTTPPGETVRVTMHHDSPTASTELLASFGSTPDSLSAQFAGEPIGTGTRELVIPTTQNGTYFILARTNNDTNPNAPKAFDLVATTALFGIDRVTPSTVGAGVATITIKGARFDDTTTFSVRDPQTGFLLNPTAVTLVDAATARVTFDFSSLSHRSYDILADKLGVTVSHASAFDVEAASTQRNIELSHNFPGALRGGRAFDAVVTLANIGNVDIDVVVLEVRTSNDPAVQVWATDLGKIDIPVAPGAPNGTSVLIAALAPGESRSTPITLSASTAYPAHGQLPVVMSAFPYSRTTFRDGPLYDYSEQIRLATLGDPSTPVDIRVLAEDQIRWWSAIRDYFNTYGFDVPSRNVADGGRASTYTGLYICSVVGTAAGIATGNPGVGFGVGIGCGILWYECSRLRTCDVLLNCIVDPIFLGPIGAWICLEVIQSWDPNEKDAPAGYGVLASVRRGDPLEYKVLFENLSQATAPAAEIRITDELDPSLDPNSVRFDRVQFGNTRIDIPPDRSSFQTVVDVRDQHQVFVEVNARVDVANERVSWTLTALDPETRQLPADPTLGFLPPNVVPPEGEGFVEFTVKSFPGTPTGTVIRNKASIVFDYNEPIETNEVFNTIDAGAPTSAIGLLPPQSASPFVVRWAAQDDVGGSGVAVVDLFVKADDGPFELWLSSTGDWAYFDGEVGKTYSFYAVGRDFVGNVEDTPATPDAVTTVTSLRRPGDVDFDGDVDLVDHQLFAQCFRVNGPDSIGGPEAEVASACAEADLNTDRRVDLSDCALLQNGFMSP